VSGARNDSRRNTVRVSDELFRQVYDSPRSLPGKEKWVTTDEDVRAIERVLGMKSRTIGAPLWVSGDTRHCKKCGRETNWLDIVTSALGGVHEKELIVKVILGKDRFVNVEAPHAIQGLVCYKCEAPITDLRSFKCHNWAYADTEILQIIGELRPGPQ
jgi:hypothetical protein